MSNTGMNDYIKTVQELRAINVRIGNAPKGAKIAMLDELKKRREVLKRRIRNFNRNW